MVFGLMSLIGPGTQSLGLRLEHLSLDNKCALTVHQNTELVGLLIYRVTCVAG